MLLAALIMRATCCSPSLSSQKCILPAMFVLVGLRVVTTAGVRCRRRPSSTSYCVCLSIFICRTLLQATELSYAVKLIKLPTPAMSPAPSLVY